MDADLGGIFRSVDVAGAGAVLRVHLAGASASRPIVLLHGFPGHWSAWLPLAERLSEAGRSIWIPELRGYGASDRPRSREAYRLDLLSRDVEAVVRRAGAPAVLVGHDWGGPIAWRFAEERPELVDRLVLVNGPPSGLMRLAVRRPTQAVRSSYILLFLIPRLAEWALEAADQWALRKILSPFSATPRGRTALAELGEPGALTAALNYYRANLARPRWRSGSTRTVRIPVLALWSGRDPALGTAMLRDLPRFAERLSIRVFAGHAHWLQLEAPDRIATEILAFLGAE